MKDDSFWISVSSLAIALGLLLWNIYKAYRKPRLKVILSLSPQSLTISATNHGPGKVTIRNCIVLKSRWAFFKRLFKKDDYKYIQSGSKNLIYRSLKEYKHIPSFIPIPIPTEALDMGEEEIFDIDYNKNDFLKSKEFIKIGLIDSYGRKHWASKKDYKRVKKEFEKIFKNKQ